MTDTAQRPWCPITAWTIPFEDREPDLGHARCPTCGRRVRLYDANCIPPRTKIARHKAPAGQPTLFVQPDPAEGFTRSQYEQVRTFVAEHAAIERALL